ncbi:MAG: deoxyribose-phosphate aldolase [Bacteroidetes bacterium]|nr:MAG: deoxyribose-phosphate aldolase [Bacteroidota bacterium]
MNLSKYIDHTLLKPDSTKTDLERLCAEARHHLFAAVCIPPAMVERTTTMIAGSDIKLATVIGFPFGYSVTATKMAELNQAIDDGAQELDVVINLIHLKNGEWHLLDQEMAAIIDQAHARNCIVKVIIESGILTEKEIIACCDLYGKLGADFVKTSTGYASKGASIEAVQLMRERLPPSVRIKASGGIRTYDFAKALIDAGADRLGCSTSVAIVEGALTT